MSQSSGVILRTVQFGFFSPPPKAHPSDIYFVSYNDGRIRAFTGVPSVTQREGSRFCYVVDTAERRVNNSFTVPTSVEAYSFTIEVEATWKVTDPEAVVRAALSDGNEVVLAWLKDELWLIGREFHPENAVGAETAARSALSQLKNLDGGITVLRSTARFRVDTRLTTAVLERDQDAHQSERDEQKMQDLRRLVEGSEDAPILLHLIRHPDDTATVLQLMTDARDKNQRAQFELLDRLLAQNFITDADAQPLRDSVLGQTTTPAVRMRPITPHVTPPALPPVTASAPDPAHMQSPAQPTPAPAPTKKAYVIEDTPTSAQSVRMRPVKQPPPTQPAPQSAPNPIPSAGGVKKWKSLKKPDQEPE